MGSGPSTGRDGIGHQVCWEEEQREIVRRNWYLHLHLQYRADRSNRMRICREGVYTTT